MSDKPIFQPNDAPAGGWGIRDGRGFGALAAVGMIDNATRTGFLTFLPFVLIALGLWILSGARVLLH